MKKLMLLSVFGLFFLTLASFSVHKFYVAIFQINYAEEKKMLQITSRIFIDDMNDILYKKYNKKTNLGEKTQTGEDVSLMQKYVLNNFKISINGQQKQLHYLSYELEGNVIICYYNIKDISKIKKLEVQNTVLFDFNSEQQNIIQTTIYGKKQNFLLTEGNAKGMLNI